MYKSWGDFFGEQSFFGGILGQTVPMSHASSDMHIKLTPLSATFNDLRGSSCLFEMPMPSAHDLMSSIMCHVDFPSNTTIPLLGLSTLC